MQKLEKARKKVREIKGFYKHLLAYLLINIFLLSMAWFNLKPGQEFFKWSTFITALTWGIGLLVHAISVFGSFDFLGKGWEERKIKEMMEKERQRTSRWE